MTSENNQDVSKLDRRIRKIEIVFSANPFMPDYNVQFTSGTGHVRELVLPAVKFHRLMRSTVMVFSKLWKQTDVRFTPSDGWCHVTYERFDNVHERYGDTKNGSNN